MKRFLYFLLACLLLLSACSFGTPAANSTTFYYCKADYGYGDSQGIIAGESRELSQNASDLTDTLALYLVGPLDEGLYSPLVDMKLLSVKERDGHLQIRLSEPPEPLSDAAFSLGAACLTLTSLELADLSQVTVTCPEHSVTMDRDNLLFLDNTTSAETIMEEPQ